MIRDPQTDDRLFDFTAFLAYGWAYAFTAFAALVGMSATRMWPPWLTVPAVLIGFGVLFSLVMVLRPFLIDALVDLGLREKFGIFLAHALVFMAPRLMTPRATLIDCLIALQAPLVLFLLRRENFIRLYGVNFLLVALSIFVDWQTQKGGYDWAAWLVVFLVGGFAADHFFLEIDRYPNLTARPVARPVLATAKYGFVALAGGGLVFLLTPQLAPAGRAARDDAVVQTPGGVQSLSAEALLELVWDSFVLMVLIVVALAILQYLKKKYGRKGEGEEVDMGTGVLRMVRKALRPRPRPPEMPRGFSAREQILRGYWAWCDEMERFGLAREPDVTPKEFAVEVGRLGGAVASPVHDLTCLFELAKYDRRAPTRDEANAFFSSSRRVIETLLASLQKK